MSKRKKVKRKSVKRKSRRKSRRKNMFKSGKSKSGKSKSGKSKSGKSKSGKSKSGKSKSKKIKKKKKQTKEYLKKINREKRRVPDELILNILSKLSNSDLIKRGRVPYFRKIAIEIAKERVNNRRKEPFPSKDKKGKNTDWFLALYIDDIRKRGGWKPLHENTILEKAFETHIILPSPRYPSIQSAVDTVKKGGQLNILVTQNVVGGVQIIHYPDPIRLKWNTIPGPCTIDIRADTSQSGPKLTWVAEGAHENALDVDGPGVNVRVKEFKMTGGRKMGTGISVDDGGNVVLKRVDAVRCGWGGISVNGRGSGGVLIDCTASDNEPSGLWVGNHAVVTLRGSFTANNNSEYGIESILWARVMKAHGLNLTLNGNTKGDQDVYRGGMIQDLPPPSPPSS